MSGVRSHDQSVVEMIKSDPEFAEEYLRAAIEELDKPDGDQVFKVALRHFALARGGIVNIAAKTGKKREAISRALSSRGNPTFKTLLSLLSSLGIKLSATSNRKEQETILVKNYHYIEASAFHPIDDCGHIPRSGISFDQHQIAASNNSRRIRTHG